MVVPGDFAFHMHVLVQIIIQDLRMAPSGSSPAVTGLIKQ